MENQAHKFFFLIALPRSGNTLFASIMNQNPEIVCTGNSITLEIMKELFLLKTTDSFKNFPDHKSLDNVLDSVYDSYYKDWPQRIIIDRGPVLTEGNKILIDLISFTIAPSFFIKPSNFSSSVFPNLFTNELGFSVYHCM